MTIGCLILAGGKSSRMGYRKSSLKMNGTTFLDRLVRELGGFPELLISVDDDRIHPEISYPMVKDLYPEHGPLGGLYSALSSCRSDALLVVPCDVPLFCGELAYRICSYYKEHLNERTEPPQLYDALIAVTDDERIHPLCGIYHKNCLPVLKKCLEAHQLKMMSALEQLNIQYYHTEEDSWRLKNVNTPEEYRNLTTPNILAISGYKNSGKTTFIERLIPELTERGLLIATIKHDGHSFEPDVPGTDSYRFWQAGASASIVFDNEKCSIVKKMAPDTEQLISLAGDVDLILLEGFKTSDYPKIEILRAVGGQKPMEFLTHRIAYISDMDLENFQSADNPLPVFDINDSRAVADFIVKAHHQGILKGYE